MTEFSQSTQRLLFLHNFCNHLRPGMQAEVEECQVYKLYAPNAAEFTEWLESHGLTVAFDVPRRMYTIGKPFASAGLAWSGGEQD